VYYLHSFGIAHRDLKPENILMVDDGDEADVKLVDFGLSKTFGPGETCKEPFGTLCYVAPEILL
jgi:serine/threonine protein kinase